MDTVCDKSYIGENQINNARGVTPSFSTYDNQFDISQTQFTNDFLCLNDKAQEMFLRKLVNSGVSVGSNTVIDGLFNKYCLGLGAEEKKSLARSLKQARLEGSGIKEESEVNVDKRRAEHHANVPKKVAQNKKVAKKKIEPASGKSTLIKVAKWALVLGAAGGVLVVGKKLYDGLIIGSLNGKKVDGVNMGWLAMAYRNVVDSLTGKNLIEAAKNKVAAASIVQGHCNVKIGGQGVCEMAQSVYSSGQLKDFVKELTKINKESDTRGFFGKIFKPAPQPIFNVSKGKKVVREVRQLHEDVKNAPLYQGALKQAGLYDIIPSKWSLAASIANAIYGLSPALGVISPFLKFIPYAGPALAIGAQVLSFCSGPISQFIQQNQANEVK